MVELLKKVCCPEFKPNRYGMNPRNTFEAFVVGSNNQFAHAAALAVSQSPAKTYNPLFRERHEISVSSYATISDELYSSILRGTSQDEYLFLRSAFLTPWLLAGRSWCRAWPSPLDQSEWSWLKLNSQ